MVNRKTRKGLKLRRPSRRCQRIPQAARRSVRRLLGHGLRTSVPSPRPAHKHAGFGIKIGMPEVPGLLFGGESMRVVDINSPLSFFFIESYGRNRTTLRVGYYLHQAQQTTPPALRTAI